MQQGRVNTDTSRTTNGIMLLHHELPTGSRRLLHELPMGSRHGITNYQWDPASCITKLPMGSRHCITNYQWDHVGCITKYHLDHATASLTTNGIPPAALLTTNGIMPDESDASRTTKLRVIPRTTDGIK